MMQAQCIVAGITLVFVEIQTLTFLFFLPFNLQILQPAAVDARNQKPTSKENKDVTQWRMPSQGVERKTKEIIDSNYRKGPHFTELIEDMVVNKAQLYDSCSQPHVGKLLVIILFIL